jgi:hypothetical protein
MRFLGLIALTLSVALISGCGSDSSDSKSTSSSTSAKTTKQGGNPPKTSTTATGSPTALEGSYTAKLSKKEGREVGAGTWKLTFAGTNAYFTNPGRNPLGAGSPVTVTSDRVAFRPGAICGRQVKGSYNYTLNGSTLEFSKPKDECQRRSDLLAVTWTKKKSKS